MKRSKPSGRVRVVDVARMAGCSAATVSRAMNTPDRVSAPVLARVQSAVRRLGFTPDNAARALRSRRTHICGTVIPTLNHSIYAREVNALQRRLGELGYSLIVTTSDYDPAQEFDQMRNLVERGAEGIMLVGDSHEPRLYDFLESRQIPYINTYVFNPESGHPCVGFDNRHAARQLTEFLLLLGHTDIGIIVGVTEANDRASQRLEATEQVLAESGLALPPHRVTERPYTIEAGYEGMRALFSRRDRPTAVICYSDILALGALTFCYDEGIAVPDAVSVVGFDNLAYAAYTRPPLTTIEVPAHEMGGQAADYLVSCLHGEVRPLFRDLETKLIVRRTTQPPPGFRRESG